MDGEYVAVFPSCGFCALKPWLVVSTAASSSGESQSEDEDEDSSLSSSSAAGGWGRGGVRSRSKGGKSSRQGSGAGGRRSRSGGDLVSSSSLAKKYEDDEEACFTRVKELWHERVSSSVFVVWFFVFTDELLVSSLRKIPKFSWPAEGKIGGRARRAWSSVFCSRGMSRGGVVVFVNAVNFPTQRTLKRWQGA